MRDTGPGTLLARHKGCSSLTVLATPALPIPMSASLAVLPLMSQTPGPDGSRARVPHLSSVRPPDLEGEASPLPPSVLIAEDHEDSRDALQTLLEALGYRVHVAGDGAEAVAQARLHHPDLILMDMMMPRMDGFEATRLLRGDPGFDAVRIIAITAMDGARPAVLQAGCNDLVVKPIDIRAFIERVRGWIGAGRRDL